MERVRATYTMKSTEELRFDKLIALIAMCDEKKVPQTVRNISNFSNFSLEYLRLLCEDHPNVILEPIMGNHHPHDWIIHVDSD